MAIPEVMENQSAVATTFPAMDAMATIGWMALQQLIRVVRPYLRQFFLSTNPPSAGH